VELGATVVVLCWVLGISLLLSSVARLSTVSPSCRGAGVRAVVGSGSCRVRRIALEARVQGQSRGRCSEAVCGAAIRPGVLIVGAEGAVRGGHGTPRRVPRRCGEVVVIAAQTSQRRSR